MDTLFTTADTIFIDTVKSIPPGTFVSYIVRTVGLTFAVSYNEGPVDINIH